MSPRAQKELKRIAQFPWQRVKGEVLRELSSLGLVKENGEIMPLVRNGILDDMKKDPAGAGGARAAEADESEGE